MSRLSLLCIFVLSLALLLSFSSNPPQGRTGAPGEATCATVGCHFGTTIAFDGHIELQGLPDNFETGQSYDLTLDLIVDRGTPIRGGFQMVALTDDDRDVGGFSNPGESSTISSSNGRSYFEHDPAKNFEDSDTLSYPFAFQITETTEANHIIFYAAANFANGSGSSGDRVVTFSDTIKVGVSNDSLNVTSEAFAPSCPNGIDAILKITPEGGVPPYSFFLEEQEQMSDSCITFEGLISGDYNLTVVDANSQDIYQMIHIPVTEIDSIPPVLSCVSDTLTITSCAPFFYPVPRSVDNCSTSVVELISGKGPNQSFEAGLNLEVYRAIDEQGNTSLCTIYIYNAVLIRPDIAIRDVSCAGDQFGSVDVSVEGLNPPFSVRHVDDIHFDSLPAGEHMILISDQTGCSITQEILIKRKDALLININEIKQPLNSTSGDGSIDIEVEGGTKPYSFIWRTEDEIFSNEEDLTLLFPGEYIVEVIDVNDCSVLSDTIRLDALTNIVEADVTSSLSVFPNPAKEMISISATNLDNIQTVEFFSLSGKKIKTTNSGFKQISVQGLPSGLSYILVTLENGKRGLTEFIKID